MADSEGRFYVTYNLNPVSFASCGVTWGDEETPEQGFGKKPDGWRWLTREQFDELSGDEPSKIIAGWLGLPYQKYLDTDPGSQPNIVELVAGGDEEDDCAWDQVCAFGHRVEGHAVYCHNSSWIDSPRKCRRSWYTGGERRDTDCPGFLPNPRPGAAVEKYTAEEAATIQREKDEADAREKAEWDALTPEQKKKKREALRRAMDAMMEYVQVVTFGGESTQFGEQHAPDEGSR